MTLTRENMLRERMTGPAQYDSVERIFQLGLLFFILYMAYVALKLSSTRFFDFDEYQVLYESASLVRGKALYSDRIGVHFPFMNVVISLLLGALGFKTASVVVVRYFVLLFSFVTLIFVFKITEMLWNKTTALIAVALTVSCMVFLHKGIEIRHDLFNMAFNTAGAYWALKYLKQPTRHSIWLSGLMLGLAIASTQKAAIWSVGIMIGLLLGLARGGYFRSVAKVSAIYAYTTILPMLTLFVYLYLTVGESFGAFLGETVIGPLDYFVPEKANKIYPFPYTREAIFGGLLYENALFYLFSVSGLFWAFKEFFQHNSAKGIIAFWASVGMLFYLITSRPFHQSLLPTIPAMGILAAGFITNIRKIFRFSSRRIGVGIEVLGLISVLAWPVYLIVHGKAVSPTIMDREMQNISFCLDHLKADEKVLCFTQQQVFFDPVFRMQDDECGRRFLDFDAACFENRMIREQCKVVIDDYLTTLLSKGIRAEIGKNYVSAGVGQILIPGFAAPPGSTIKKVWVAGDYYTPSSELRVDGKELQSHFVKLEQKEYLLDNASGRAVLLVHIFEKEKMLSHVSGGAD
jgi:hypothetical protein